MGLHYDSLMDLVIDRMGALKEKGHPYRTLQDSEDLHLEVIELLAHRTYGKARLKKRVNAIALLMMAILVDEHSE